MNLLQLPFFDALSDAQTVLLAGAGGGFDIYSGLPLYFALRDQGKTVHLANLSFTNIYATDGKRIGEALVEVRHDTAGHLRYFPERYLCQHLHQTTGETVPIYCFDRVGVAPITMAYQNLFTHLGGVDAVVLVDGGTDSLMRGDEPQLGTPEEDMASLAAVDALNGVSTKLLACLGFGVDTFHGVCHAFFLEAVAELSQQGGYLGAWSLLPQMPEVARYKAAVEQVQAQMFNHPSIVCASITSALDGHFGNYHATYRTEGSPLFINPLMSLYWGFTVDAVVKRNLYLDTIRATKTYWDTALLITTWRNRHQANQREWVSLPM